MTVQIEQMTVEEYANLETALGQNVEKSGQVYWSRGRGYFYRPLLSFEALHPSQILVPRQARGGFQHVVKDKSHANSAMGFLMLTELDSYGLEHVGRKRRWLINDAGKHFTIRPVRNLEQFQSQGFEAYLSFYARTGYRYLAGRRRKKEFCRWAATLLNQPKALVLGAFDADTLKAVSVSYWVQNTLIYATYFSHESALHAGAAELMLHTVRVSAGKTAGINQILARRYQGGNGMDQYYIMRGAKLVWEPANLHLHPAMNWFLKCFQRRQYAVLCGTAENAA